MSGFFVVIGLIFGLQLLIHELTKDQRKGRRKAKTWRPRNPSLADNVAEAIVDIITAVGEACSRGRPIPFRPTQPVSRPGPPVRNVEPVPTEIEVTCPTCKSVLSAPVEMAGQEATCEGCRTIVRVPPLSDPPPIAREALPQLTRSLLRDLEWRRFEQVTEAYFKRIGWHTEPAGIGPDGGVDIHLFRPSESRPAALVQCKAWNTYKVGVKPIRELFGVMAAQSVGEGYFVASGEYTEEARAFARGKKLTLINGDELIDRIQALKDEDQCQLYKLATSGDYMTPTCPRCGKKMVRRIGSRGASAGHFFWGCPGYPRCKAILKSRSDEED